MSKRILQGLILSLCLSGATSVFAAVKEYHLDIAEGIVNVTGKKLKRITVNGQFPAPQLEFEEGDDAIIHVHNSLKNQDSSIHWHGLLLPGLMDGVPGFNGFKGIKPQQDFVYKFKVRQSGTYWYHAHSMGQEQDGLYGAFIIRPKKNEIVPAAEKVQRDYVVMLSDFHPSTSAQILANLKKDAEYYQNRRETVFDVLKQTQRQGVMGTWKDRSMWNQMRMLKTDLSDVTGYTFLINGQSPQKKWTGEFQANERVRLRFINASAMTFYDVRIPNLKMTVVSADGQPVQPVSVDEFRIGNAETYDVIVEPKDVQYQIQAEAIDRSGFAIGRLKQQNSDVAALAMPQSRPRARLNMADMGHASSAMDHSVMNHSAMGHEAMQHDQSTSAEMNAHDMNADQMNQSKMNHSEMKHTDMSGMDHIAIQDSAHPMPAMQQMPEMNSAQHSSAQSHSTEMHSNTEKNPIFGWDNASTPLGLKALQYSDLKALHPQKDTRQPERELVIRLGGNMERYIWTINGKKFSEAEPLQVKFGERIRLKFINDSMMAHPMHLHGMFMQLENGQSAEDLPNKHTLIVPPGKSVSALLTADELGEWAIHCHLLYHMSSGMMNKLVVAQVDSKSVAMPSMQSKQKMTEQRAAHEHH